MEPRILDTPLIPQDALDRDAIQVVRRLNANGHQAYLVGGCVRDLLLRHRPKDFDIATSARPRQVKSLFRNCRIIGRRFKLAHLHFGSKILEVSTFRRAPETDGSTGDEDLLIRRDNEFGTAQEDALRRDFTINALFYDPQRHQVLDWAQGLEDLDRRRIRTINDPWIRCKEDPVRILRAIKFATRLGLEIEKDTWQAMIDVAGDLSLSAPPRVLEEIIRFLRSRNSLAAFQMLRQTGASKVILPAHHAWLDRTPLPEREVFWRHLEALDAVLSARGDKGGEPTTAFLLGALFLPLVEASGSDPIQSAEKVLNPFAEWSRISRRDRARSKRICAVQGRFLETRRRVKVRTFVAQDWFQEALDLLHISCLARGRHWESYQRWRQRRDEVLGLNQERTEPIPPVIPAPSPAPAQTREVAESPQNAAPPTNNRTNAKATPAKAKGERSGRTRKSSSRSSRSRSRVDHRETMCPPTSRCVIPDYADRDITPPERLVPEFGLRRSAPPEYPAQ